MKKRISLLIAICFSFISIFSQNTHPSQNHLIILLGQDTVGIERYQINGNEVLTETIRRVNNLRRQKARIVYREDGSIESVETRVFNAADSLIQEELMKSEGDSLYFQRERNGKTNTWVRFGRPHLLVHAIPFFASYAKLILNYENAPETNFSIQYFNDPIQIKKTGENDYELTVEVLRTLRLKFNADKQFLALNSRGTGLLSYETRKVDQQVYEYYAERWWQDPNMKIISTISPRIKEASTVHDAQIQLDYSSVSKRGRITFGGLVPFNKFWRTGSNRATHIEFDKDLIFGGKNISKGRYTLYTIPHPDQWFFLLNKQTGQWGSYYDEDQEILRVPMKTSHDNPEQETLRIEVEEMEEGGMIIISWDQVKAEVAFELDN